MNELNFTASLTVVGIEKIQLLENISRLGSITDAAKEMGISYRTAWNSIQIMNCSSFGPIIETAAGGKRGGSAILTPIAQKILLQYQTVISEHKNFIQKINEANNLIRRPLMKTSARNQFLGSVKKIKKGAVNSEVELLINGGDYIVASITNESVARLNIKKNIEVWAIIKASWVILSNEENITLSARNHFTGTIDQIKKGAVNSEVVLKLKSGNYIVATVTNESIKVLKLKKGLSASAFVKASHVILGVNS